MIRQSDPDRHVDEEYDGNFSHPDDASHTLALRNIPGNRHSRNAGSRGMPNGPATSGLSPTLATGNVTIRSNTLVTDNLTERAGADEPTATGLESRETWSGASETVEADIVVLAAGAIETPRL